MSLMLESIKQYLIQNWDRIETQGSPGQSTKNKQYFCSSCWSSKYSSGLVRSVITHYLLKSSFWPPYVRPLKNLRLIDTHLHYEILLSDNQYWYWNSDHAYHMKYRDDLRYKNIKWNVTLKLNLKLIEVKFSWHFKVYSPTIPPTIFIYEIFKKSRYSLFNLKFWNTFTTKTNQN